MLQRALRVGQIVTFQEITYVQTEVYATFSDLQAALLIALSDIIKLLQIQTPASHAHAENLRRVLAMVHLLIVCPAMQENIATLAQVIAKHVLQARILSIPAHAAALNV